MHVILMNDEEYLSLLDAVYDEQAVEGSLNADNVMSAKKIRDMAEKRNSPLKDQKLATISKALGVVLRRYGVSRKDRRDTVDGRPVASSNGDND